MQPYFMPYIGYFQLINAVDVFVVYDNIEYTKKGWINRNRILVNGKDEFITLPLKKDSDYLHINQRHLAESFDEDKRKILRKIKESYRKAPNFNETYALAEEILHFKSTNLFDFVYNSINILCDYLEINVNFKISSTLKINHSLKSEEKVINVCETLNAHEYYNPIGGQSLYQSANFYSKGIKLIFLNPELKPYKQFGFQFVPKLSIIDVLMFNTFEEVKLMLSPKH
jgi:hypothetical protein